MRQFKVEFEATPIKEMLFRVVAACVLVGISLIHAAAQRGATRDEERVLTAISNDDGHFEYRVSSRVLNGTKMWSPESDEPPLSIAAATSIARKRAHLAHADDFVIIQVGFHAVASDDHGGTRWYCDVEYYNRQDAFNPTPPIAKNVVILMDGTVIEPVKMPSHLE